MALIDSITRDLKAQIFHVDQEAFLITSQLMSGLVHETGW